MEAKSPFLVVQDFISPSLCEQIVDDLEAYEPDTDNQGNPVKTYRTSENQDVIFERIQSLVPTIEEYFQAQYKGTESISFEWYPTGSTSSPICENSSYLRKSWVRTKQRDFTCVLFLSDYNDQVPFDSEYEVYGGKLEFAQHGFGFNPQRGTLIIYPSDPHFINVQTPITYGDLFQVRIQITAQQPYLYDPKKFPGDYRTWFADVV